MKLDRFLARQDSLGRTAAQRLIAAQRVCVDGAIATHGQVEVDRFAHVTLDDAVLQVGERRLHLMLHKPAGILSATCDAVHRTVIDLIDDPDRDQLHLVGRLDRASTGLILLTNDGRWSKRLTEPEHEVPKVYRVETAHPINPSAIDAFARGFYFQTENLVTRPAELEILAPCLARVTLHEGRYHQIKRMFHRVQNRVVTLHRERIGPLALHEDLAPGEWRALSVEEIAAF